MEDPMATYTIKGTSDREGGVDMDTGDEASSLELDLTRGIFLSNIFYYM